MKKKIIITFSIILLISLSLSIGIKLPIRGKIADSITKKPLANITVGRIVEIYESNIAGGSNLKYAYATKTDNNGEFYFGPVAIILFPLLDHIEHDWIIANTSLSSLDLSGQLLNQCSIKNFGSIKNKLNSASIKWEYYELGNYCSKGKWSNPMGDKFSYIKRNAIELPPKINNINDCKDSDICRKFNAFDIAVRENNENLCLDAVGQTNQVECIKNIAQSKKDISICNLIDKLEELCKQSNDPEKYCGYNKRLECEQFVK